MSTYTHLFIYLYYIHIYIHIYTIYIYILNIYIYIYIYLFLIHFKRQQNRGIEETKKKRIQRLVSLIEDLTLLLANRNPKVKILYTMERRERGNL